MIGASEDFTIRDHLMTSCADGLLPKFLIFMSCMSKDKSILVFEFPYEGFQLMDIIIEVNDCGISFWEGFRGRGQDDSMPC